MRSIFSIKNLIFSALLSAVFGAAAIVPFPAASQGTVPQQFINAQTGTTYTFVAQDCSKQVTLSNTASIAITLPQAGSVFTAGCFIDVLNTGNGVATITPTTSTIDGRATFVLSRNEGIRITTNGTNYFTQSNHTGNAALGSGSTGTTAGTASLTFGVLNAPSVTNVTPSAWIRFTLTDGNVYVIPAWR